VREPIPGSKSFRLNARRAQLLADGRKAIELVKTKPIADVLLVVGGSRARLYRAMYLADRTDNTGWARDPLLD
jgi:hypothetical protein